MKYLTVDQIREKFLDFFIAKGHHFLPSFPVVPINDNSLLLINAGMTPMKPYFTGQQQPPSPRVATCQKCIRTTDIDEVGKTERHGSFFEMLGNFSFGDYFKREMIPWSWEFVTEVMEMPMDKLYVSVYEDDDEAYDIWHKEMGLAPERITRLGREDNFWEHGVGPCGPCSELHFDRGEAMGCGKADCAVGCDCDRFMEFWNLVFIQFERKEDGNYVPLAKPSIDTGMGLDRMAMLMQEVSGIFEIDTAKTIRAKVRELAGISGAESREQKIAITIITDHIRCAVVMASDGVRPGSEGRDYVLRRLLRRAVRYGRDMGLRSFVGEVVQVVIDSYRKAYPNLAEKSAHILQVLTAEEGRFLETLETGMNLLQKLMDELPPGGTLPGIDAFKLYDTFGFPPDITKEILADKGMDFDQAGFDSSMQAQKERARAARGTATYMGADETVYHQLPPDLPTEFVGKNHYENIQAKGEILAIIANGKVVQEATPGQEVAVVLSKTPFYAAGGGQAGDIGWINKTTADATDNCCIKINDCIKAAGENTIHIGEVIGGTWKTGEHIIVHIDNNHRLATARNHTATHMLQYTLRVFLGEHVEQAGSEVTADRLRFDFTHPAALSTQERQNIEEAMNAFIISHYPVVTTITTPDEARKAGATALFGEKYGDTVCMVSIGDGPYHPSITNPGYSIELCGGTHVSNTTEIGAFKLISENGIAAGVRRIEAATGYRATTLFREAADTLAEIAGQLKVPANNVPERLAMLINENKELKKATAQRQSEEAKNKIVEIAADLLKTAATHNGFTLIAAAVPGFDIETLRQLSDKLKTGFPSGCLLLAATHAETGAVQFLASATDDAVKKGIHAGNLVKTAAQLCGGNGGGKPNHAQAGGKDAAKVGEAITAGLAQMKEMLG